MPVRPKLPLLLCVLLLAACGRNENLVLAAPPEASAAFAAAGPGFVHGNLLEDAAALQAAQQALENLPPFRGRALNVFGNIDFFDGVRPRIELDVQRPLQPSKIDHYVYEQGRWRYTDTLRIPPEGLAVAERLTPLSQVAFADAAERARVWAQKARAVGAVVTEPYYVSYVVLEKGRKRFWHTATIEAVGAQYYLSFHADGTVWEFKLLEAGR